MDQNNPVTSKIDILKEAEQLLADVKKAGDDFMQKTGILIKGINDEADELNKEIDVINTDLVEMEKGAINKMDAAVLEFIAEDEEEEGE